MFLLLEAVLQRYAAVEHQMLRRAVPVVHAEITGAHELEGRGVDTGAVFLLVKGGGYIGHGLLHFAAGEDGERIGIQAGQNREDSGRL